MGHRHAVSITIAFFDSRCGFHARRLAAYAQDARGHFSFHFQAAAEYQRASPAAMTHISRFQGGICATDGFSLRSMLIREITIRLIFAMLAYFYFIWDAR